MEDYKNKYENLLHDIDIAIAGQKEGETKIVLQNLKERHTESEDERIRKWLIEIVEEVRKANPTNAEHNGNCSEALAWLEKQGGKIDIANKEYWRGYREGKQVVVDKYSELENQGEQKSELKELEDEKMRKEIISYLKGCYGAGSEEYIISKRKQWIAWLEKQGTKESKKTSIWHHWKDGIAGNGEGKLIYLIKNGNDYRLSSCLGYECDYILLSDLDKLMLQEKQGEQKYTDKVEPKSDIEKGKWYVCNTPRYRDFVLGKAYYCSKNGMLKPNENEMARYVARYCFHLWTIRDAKDGDVLATPLPKGYEAGEQIFIFKEINCRDYVSNCIEYYCRVCQGVFYENKIGFMGTTDEIFHPATKEQRDFLFQKMHEAGYEWNAEKKELKKIEQKPEINDDVLSRFAFYQYDNDTIYLSSLFVRESDRKCGYGSKILKAAEEVAKTFGILKIRLKVESNTWMEEWYKKNGYEYLSAEGEYAWLEKQVEQKHSADKPEPKFKVGDCIERKDGLGCHARIIFVGGNVYGCEKLIYSEDSSPFFEFMFKNQDEFQISSDFKQNPAWSEDDETGFGDALWAVQQARTIAKDENDMGNLWYAEYWLKSLKERMKGE